MENTFHICTRREFQVLGIRIGPSVVCIANVHFPDRTKCLQTGISLEGVLDALVQELDSLAQVSPWHTLLLAGDFNAEFVAGGQIGNAVSGSRMCPRSSLIMDKLERYLFTWSSTHLEEASPYTHVHHCTKHRSVIDYVLVSTPVGGKSSVSCRIEYECGFDSDHIPISFDVCGWTKGKQKSYKPRKFSSASRMKEVAVQNRFSALMSEAIATPEFASCSSSFEALEYFQSAIVKSQETACREAPEAVPKVTLRSFCEAEISALDNAVGEHRRPALNALNARKKLFFAARAKEKLRSEALLKPRDDKTAAKGRFPIRVGDALSDDPQVWMPCFTSLYQALFHDAANPREVQQERLLRLRNLAGQEGHISLPLCLLCEHLSRGRGKLRTAPGLDGVLWGSLVSMPHRVLLALRVVLEARINAYPCSVGVVGAWREVLLHMIPKNGNPELPSHWRPIALSSVFQKLFLSIVTALLEEYGPADPLQRGFRSGGQTMEVAETVRVLARKSLEWGCPVYVLKADISRAFDNIRHAPLEGALSRLGVPAKLQHCIFQELECHLNFSCQGAAWSGFAPSKGGRQGGSETPTLWNLLLRDALVSARTRWWNLGLGWKFDATDVYAPHLKELIDALPPASPQHPLWLPYLAWADDLVLLGPSKDCVRKMWAILSEELGKIFLTWKPGSLELYRPGLAEGDLWEDECWPSCLGDFAVKHVRRIAILGILVSESASDLDACRHRIAQAWVHFHSRKKVLCSKIVPLHLRWARLQETVMRTALYGCGGWALCESVTNELATFERHVLGITLNLWRRPDEVPHEFHARLHSKITFFMNAFAWTPLRVSAENLCFGWVGHVVRSGVSPVALTLLWRSVAAVRADPRFGTTLRRARAGRPARDPTEHLSQSFGPFWEEVALDRADWRAAKILHLQTLPGFGVVGEGSGDWRLHKHISKRAAEILDGRRMLLPSLLMVSGDSALAVNQTNGIWPAVNSEYRVQVKRIRWLLYCLEHGWKFSSYTCDEGILVYRPRSCNALADACCNYALDNNACVQRFWDIDFDPKGCPVHVSFDGAARGNPGPAALGCVVQVHCRGAWHVVAALSCCIGEATNNFAEFEAAVAALRLLTAWCSFAGMCV
jgi:hypothetical protein